MQNLNQDAITSSKNIKQQIRCIISNVYDLQKLRISTGNRLVQSFYIQLGVEPSTSPDSADKDEKKMIDKLKLEYKRITDAVVASDGKTVKSQIKALNESKDKSDILSLIRNETDYKLIESYVLLLKAEEEAIKVLDKYVKEHPLWDAFFKDIKGCGTLMSAVCIAYLDIEKAKYVSSFYRYCGLDTVQDEDKDGNLLFLKKVNGQVLGQKVRVKYGYYNEEGEQVFEDVKPTTECDADGNQLFISKSGEVVLKFPIERVIDGESYTVYEDIESEEEYVGDVVISQHGRRMGDTEMFEYIDKAGNKALKRGITYNPVVKTKLMGVLTGCLLKAKDPTYSRIYYDYRGRLDNSAKCKNYTDGHKNMMAQRYMIKQFLRNLHTTWRQLEGLPIYEPYEVEKLGNKPHHLNEQQYLAAKKWQAEHPDGI